MLDVSGLYDCGMSIYNHEEWFRKGVVYTSTTHYGPEGPVTVKWVDNGVKDPDKRRDEVALERAIAACHRIAGRAGMTSIGAAAARDCARAIDEIARGL